MAHSSEIGADAPLAFPDAQERMVFILEEDPDLGENLSEPDRRAATRLLRGKVLEVNSPRWQPPWLEPTTSFGLLVLDGLVGRRVTVGDVNGAELLGSGDILRPWEQPLALTSAAPEVSWRVFRPARLAVLDERATRIIGSRPQLVVNFSARLLRRSRYAAYLSTIGHLTRVDDRLLLTLWHLATNWGRVTTQGYLIPFPLTHEVLGEIVGARRPSVSVSMSQLTRRGEVMRRDDGCYLLTGEPPPL